MPAFLQYLTETVSSPDAIWTLASIVLPRTPKADFKRDEHNPLAEAALNYELIHVEAYIVYVDMVYRNEVAYKLTEDTIKILVKYHERIHCVDAEAGTDDWPSKKRQCKKLHEDFVHDINNFVFHTPVEELEGLEEGGGGELVEGRSDEVKEHRTSLMKPLIPPPPPRAVGIVEQTVLLPSCHENNVWWQPSIPNALHTFGVLPNPHFAFLHSAVSSSYGWHQVAAFTPALPFQSMVLYTEYGAGVEMMGDCYLGGIG
ncbi:hypothetical protein EDB81DRAFT_871325 [Dactylonectria macrodidyma]|uniref:Uncharacterized protein n=1 Tax=Dactylonectria macrodidyma TaxID=307937 RepID=A0A9P9IRR5_9HYPO|nr:hypothetical protein EDB81DRAFT_871325 [Dactylonectria macrodidyma]